MKELTLRLWIYQKFETFSISPNQFTLPVVWVQKYFIGCSIS